MIFYVKENGARFKGVRIAKRTLRDYPAYDAARHVGYAAQIFGTIGEVTTADLGDTTPTPAPSRATSSVTPASSARTTAGCAVATAPST